MTACSSSIRGRVGERVGVFVGGDDAWKEETAAFWARLAHDRGALCHVGRVNSGRRLAICQAAGVDSFDGSGPSRFEKALHEMEAALRVAVQIGEVLEIQADDGIHRRLGSTHEFRFDTWDELAEMEAAGTHYLQEKEQ